MLVAPFLILATTTSPVCTVDQLKALWSDPDEHPVTEVAEGRAQALRGQGWAESAWKDPALFTEARGLPIVEPWNMGRTPMGGVSMGVMGTVPWLPQRWAQEAARDHEADAALVAVGEQKLDLFATLLHVVVDDDLLGQQARVQQDRIELFTSLAAVARANALVGAGRSSDAVLLEARAASVRAQIQALDANRRALAGRWVGVLPEGAPPSCHLADGGPLQADTLDLERLDARPRLAALDDTRQAADARKLAAWLAWVPEPTLKAGYVWRPDYGVHDGIDFIGGMVTVPIPISPGKRLGRLRVAQAQDQMAAAEREVFLREARGRRELLMGRITAEQIRIEQLLEEARPVAASASEVAQAAYKVGHGSVASVIEAERMVLDLDLAVVEARARQAHLRVDLFRLMGAPLEKLGTDDRAAEDGPAEP